MSISKAMIDAADKKSNGHWFPIEKCIQAAINEAWIKFDQEDKKTWPKDSGGFNHQPWFCMVLFDDADAPVVREMFFSDDLNQWKSIAMFGLHGHVLAYADAINFISTEFNK